MGNLKYKSTILERFAQPTTLPWRSGQYPLIGSNSSTLTSEAMTLLGELGAESWKWLRIDGQLRVGKARRGDSNCCLHLAPGSGLWSKDRWVSGLPKPLPDPGCMVKGSGAV